MDATGSRAYTTAHSATSCRLEQKKSLERHVVRFSINGGMRHLLHYGMVGVIKSILRDAGVPDASVMVEVRGLRAADRTKPGNIS